MCSRMCLLEKIIFTKVSENYRSCIHLLNLCYEEVHRILIFEFLIQLNKYKVNELIDYYSEIIAIQIGIDFHKYADDKIKNSTDKRWKYLCWFHKLTTIFKLHEHRMKSSGSIALKFLEIEFCRVFIAE